MSNFHLHFLHTSQFVSEPGHKSLPGRATEPGDPQISCACFLNRKKASNLKSHLHTEPALSGSVSALSAKTEQTCAASRSLTTRR